MYTILIIEDEPRVASLLMNGLEENGYQTMVAYDGLMGLRLFQCTALRSEPAVAFSSSSREASVFCFSSSRHLRAIGVLSERTG